MMVTRDQIIAEASTWIGTRFSHGNGVKGSGCDCAHLISGTLENLGIIPPVVYPIYGRDWFRHAEHEEKYIIEMLKSLGLREIPEAEAGAGDIAVLKFGRAYSHCVFLCGDGLGIQAWPTHAKVARVQLNMERLWKCCPKRYFTTQGAN